MEKYVHGYSERESERLSDQADTLSDLLHHDTRYPAGCRVLEAGCGVGAQTISLAENSPDSRFVSIDVSARSLAQAKALMEEKSISNVRFEKADIFNPPFDAESFDHIFVCFVLEHLPNPVNALEQLKKVLKKGGSITVIEGDHGSFYCHPETEEARRTVACMVESQARMGGNSLIGRQVYPLLKKAGFNEVKTSPRMVYVDASRPGLVDGFSKKTFIAMVEGVEEQALDLKMITKEAWDKGIRDLYKATGEEGVFCYTFFKGVGVKG
ncbi:MAG: methyltransferase domain-containing protein [Desulfobacterales bacterium]|nr:methyltransferase domain-containing protein [Desulfobacterales bacterium]